MNFLIYWQMIKSFVIGFLSGAIFLCTMSFMQKNIAGYDPLLLKGYIIPIFFGGASGATLGIYLYKVKNLSVKLLQRVDNLESFLPICSNCKNIRSPESDPKDSNSWQAVESYISDRTIFQFTHSICPNCIEKLYGKEYL